MKTAKMRKPQTCIKEQYPLKELEIGNLKAIAYEDTLYLGKVLRFVIMWWLSPKTKHISDCLNK